MEERLGELLGLSGKTAVVIGGGQGMGEAAATMLAKAGCNVAVVDLELPRAATVAAKLREMGVKAQEFSADVLATADLPALVARIEDILGPPDAMVSIVGQAGWYDFLDMTEDEWDRDHARNLRYFAFTAQAVARSMKRRGTGGSIVAVSSVSGIQSAPKHAAYGAAKAGLISLVKTMAVELAPFGIRVNSIAPGTIRTPRIAADHASDAAFEDKIRNSLIPFRRRGTTDEIGKAALFLASDLASYVSGQTLAVDGGFTAQFLIGPPR